MRRSINLRSLRIMVLGVMYVLLSNFFLFNSTPANAASEWNTSSNMLPTPRENSATVVANGYVYELGGGTNDPTPISSEVDYAPLNNDGSIGAWVTSNNPLPYGLVGASAVTANDYIYIIGGYGTNNGGAVSSAVYSAPLNSDGSVGTWTQSTNSIPISVNSASAVENNGIVYVIGGTGGTSETQYSTVYSAPLNSDGSVGTWTQSTNSLPQSILGATTILNGYIYEIGGYHYDISSINPTYISESTVYIAPLNSDGSIGTWTTSSNPLPSARVAATSVAQNGYIYVMNGNNGSPGFLASVLYSQVNSDGSIGPWIESSSSLPLNIGDATSAYANGYIYVIGGSTVHALQSSTYYALASLLATPAPASPPTNLTISSPTITPILNWDVVPGAISYNIYVNNTLIGASTANTYTDNNPIVGSNTYYVTAINSGGESDPSNLVNVSIISTPVVTSANATSVNVRDLLNYQVTTTGSPIATLSESGTLPSGVDFTDNGDGTATFSGQPSVGTQGSYPTTITATNSAGSTTQTFTLTINNVNTAPTFISDASDSETYGVPFSYTIKTTGNPIPTISKISGTLPTGVTLVNNNDGTATLSGNLSYSSNSGVYTFTVRAKSSAGTTTQIFTLTIYKTPLVKSISNKVTSVGSSFTQAISATGYQTPSLTVDNLPDGLTFTDNGDGTGAINGTPTAGSGRKYTVTVTATNSQGSSSKTFTIQVNEAPAITSPSSQTAYLGHAFSFQVTSTGFPLPSISKIGALPKGITYNATTHTLSGTPANTSAGTYNLTFTAKNGSGTTTQVFTLIVTSGGVAS